MTHEHIHPMIDKILKNIEKVMIGKRSVAELSVIALLAEGHKRVYRLMRELGLKCVKFMRKSRKYNSYKGKIGKVAKNRISRRFSTPIPLQKLVTDITEFKCLGEEKLYLNPILDLYNGEVIAFGIRKRPTLDLVMDPLKETIVIIENHATYRTTIHSDQGWHYQHNQWVKTLKANKIFQSMSRKATCADNAFLLLDALEKANEASVICELTVVCREDEYKGLSEEKKARLQEMNVAVKHVSGEALNELYREMDFAFIPRYRSIYNDFSVPVKLVEYLSNELPVIATYCQAQQEIIETDGYGLICEDNPEDMAKEVSQLICFHT